MLQPKKKPVPKKTKKSTNPADDYPPMKDKRGVPTIGGGEGRTPPFTREEMEYKKKMTGLPRGKMGKTVAKAKNGSSLGMKSVKAGFDKNPGVTRADIIVAGKGQARKGAVIKKAKAGTKVKKAFLGKMLGGAGKSMLGGLAGKALGGLMGGDKSGGIGGMLGGLMGKNGKSVKKAQNGVKKKSKLLTVPRTRQIADSLDYEGDMKAQASQNRTIGTYVKDYKDAKGYDKIAQELNQSSIKDRSNSTRYRKLADAAEKKLKSKKKAKTGASVKKCKYGCK